MVLNSRNKEIKINFIAINILEHNSSHIFNIKATSNCGCIIKLLVLENTHCEFYSKAQYYKQSSI